MVIPNGRKCQEVQVVMSFFEIQAKFSTKLLVGFPPTGSSSTTVSYTIIGWWHIWLSVAFKSCCAIGIDYFDFWHWVKKRMFILKIILCFFVCQPIRKISDSLLSCWQIPSFTRLIFFSTNRSNYRYFLKSGKIGLCNKKYQVWCWKWIKVLQKSKVPSLSTQYWSCGKSIWWLKLSRFLNTFMDIKLEVFSSV